MRSCAATIIGTCDDSRTPLRMVAARDVSAVSGSNAASADTAVRSTSIGWARCTSRMTSSTSAGSVRAAFSSPSNVAELRGGRQLAVDQQVCRLLEARILREVVDRIAAIAQLSGLAVDESRRRAFEIDVLEAPIDPGLVAWFGHGLSPEPFPIIPRTCTCTISTVAYKCVRGRQEEIAETRMDIVAVLHGRRQRAGLARRAAGGRATTASSRPRSELARDGPGPPDRARPATSPRARVRLTALDAADETRSTFASRRPTRLLPRLAAHVAARRERMNERTAARLVSKPLYFGGALVGDRRSGSAGRRRRQPDAARDRSRPDDYRPRAGHRDAVELFPDDRAGASAAAHRVRSSSPTAP